MSAIHGCTVAGRNYLAHARVLAESFLSHHPDGSFSLLLVDRHAEGLTDREPFELLLPADLGIEQREFDRRATMYGVHGIAASLKPQLLSLLLSRHGSPVVLIDADGCVYAELDSIAELAVRHPVVVSPHTLDPYPLHGVDAADMRWLRDSPEQILMRAGIMNGGLVAVGPGPGAQDFLAWWSQRTSRRCVFDEAHGLMLGQTWLTLAAALFDCAVLRDRGCNVAGWNLQARDVQWNGERPRIDGGPLRHFHFAGSFDPDRPQALTPIPSIADWWTPLSERPGAARLAREYAVRLLERGYRAARAIVGPGACTPDGTPIEPWMREAYRLELMASERDGAAEPPNPFSDSSERFAEWLRGRASEAIERTAQPGCKPDALSLDPLELDAALFEGRQLLRRIGELEAARDEAIEWARRVCASLRETEAALVQAHARANQAEAELQRARATMESVWSSLSWRLTAPLRAAKGRLESWQA